MNLLLGKHQDVKSAIKKIGYITRYNAQILGKMIIGIIIPLLHG